MTCNIRNARPADAGVLFGLTDGWVLDESGVKRR